MCYDHISRFALRPVEIRRIQPPRVNSQLDMVLLRRLKGTLTPITVENAKAPEPEPETCQLRHVLPEVQTEPATFSRLVADTWEHQIGSLADEEEAVRTVAEEAMSCGEVRSLGRVPGK